jgi:hypothetical protein
VTGKRVRKPSGGVFDRASNRLSSSLRLDWTIATAIVLANYLVFALTHHGDLLGWGKPADLDAFYAAGDTTVGIIVGFTITALAFFYSMEPGRRMGYVRRTGGQLLRKVWIGAITAPLVAVGLFTIALLIDNADVHSAGIRWLIEWISIVVVLRFVRLVWLFSKLLEVATEDDVEPRASGRPITVRGPRHATRGGGGETPTIGGHSEASADSLMH